MLNNLTRPFYTRSKARPCQYGSFSWSIIPETKGSWVWFPVGAHTHVVGSIPGQSAPEKAASQCFSLVPMSVCLSVPSPLSESNEKTVLG